MWNILDFVWRDRNSTQIHTTVGQIHYISNVLRWLSLSQVNNTHIYSMSHLFQERNNTLGVNNLIDQVKNCFGACLRIKLSTQTQTHTHEWFKMISVTDNFRQLDTLASTVVLFCLANQLLHFISRCCITSAKQHRHLSLKANRVRPVLTQAVLLRLKEPVKKLPLSSQTSQGWRDEAYRWNKDRKSTLVASLKHVHAKCMVLHFHSPPSSVSHLPVSLSASFCIVTGLLGEHCSLCCWRLLPTEGANDI